MTEVLKQRIEHLIDQGFSVTQILEMQGIAGKNNIIAEMQVHKIYYEKTGKIFYETQH